MIMDRQDVLDAEAMMSPALPEPGILPWQQADGDEAQPILPLHDPAACQAERARLAEAAIRSEAALSALDDITRLIGKIRAQIAVLGERGLPPVQQDVVRNNITLLVGRIGACIERAGSYGRNLLKDGNAGGERDEGDAAAASGARNLADAMSSLLAEQGGMTNWLSMTPPNIFVAGYLLDGFAHQVDTLLTGLAVDKQALEDRRAFIDAALETGQTEPESAEMSIAASAVARAAASLS